MKIFDTSPAPGVGSRPKGARDERDSARRVRDMFSAIAPRYDLLNHLLSFSMDNRWRRLTAKKVSGILRRTDARILDLCCGTGDLAFAFEATRLKIIRDPTAHRTPIVGCDFAHPMVERAKKKAQAGSHSAEFINGDAMRMPFADKTFDLVATAFGFRNLANYESGLREIARVLRPGGRVAILEFSEPNNTVMAKMYRLYFKRVLPVIGGIISGNRAAYSYLPNSVMHFPLPPQLAKLMASAGFSEIRYQSWNFGSVVLHIGKTPGVSPAVDLEKEFGPPRRRKTDFGIRDEVRENWNQKISKN